MQYRPRELTKEYKDFQSGDLDALTRILSNERIRLFDYLMRMTGQLVKSEELADETINAVEFQADDIESLQEFLVLLYKTARNFGRDVWNADTSKLENSAYAETSSKELQRLHSLETLLRSLPANERDVVLLRARYGFALDEVAEIVVLPSSDVEVLFAQGLSTLENDMTSEAQKVPSLILDLRNFSKPENQGPETQNLSLIINDFKKTHKLASNHWRWIRLAIYAALIAQALLFKEKWLEVFTALKLYFNS